MSTATPPTPPRGHSLRWRLAVTQLVCGVVALFFWTLVPQGSLPVMLVYSLCIGNCCWMLIDGSRALLARWTLGPGHLYDWPGWRWMLPVIVVGPLLGYSVGTAVADAIFGHRSPSLLENRASVVISLVAGVLVTYFFWTREALHAKQMAAEAAERLAAETRLRLLQSQLEPHMLFNTLANLRVLIGLDAGRAQAMLDQLIAFLRATLESSRQRSHPLAREFDSLRTYLALMAVRMGPRLQVELDLPDALGELPVPPLLLQPLVENAIKHGLEPKVEGGLIRVQARRDGDRLHLLLRDTGIGLEAAAEASSGGTGFGLEQVRSRLAALYGESASLVLRPADDDRGGCEVHVWLPLEAAAG